VSVVNHRDVVISINILLIGKGDYFIALFFMKNMAFVMVFPLFW